MQRRTRQLPPCTVLALFLLAAGCSSSGGEDPAVTPLVTATPNLSIADATLVEGDSGASDLVFSVTLSVAASSDVSADYLTADGTATEGQDYTIASGTLTIATGATSATVVVPVLGDVDDETDETLTVTLSNASANVSVQRSQATGTILNDDSNSIPSASALNDTGVTTCSDGIMNGLTCNEVGAGTDQYPGQDAEIGRDVTDSFDGDGVAGFVFTKLDGAGNPLVDQTVDYATTPWSCVRDEITGRVWEVKTDDGGLHDKDWTYSWYNSNSGNVGISNGGQCDDNLNCDTQKFTTAVNATQLCGFDDWRPPTRHELISLMHFGAVAAPYIDTDYFANHAPYPYWSSSQTPGFQVAFVYFSDEGAGSAIAFESFVVRLVRGGE